MLNYNEKHIAFHLAGVLFETPRVWKIDYKTIGFVTDYAANIFCYPSQ